jgi:ATP-binding cassette subfamily B protein
LREVPPSILGGSLLLLLASIANISATLLFQPLFDRGVTAGQGSVLAPIVALQLILLLSRGVLAGIAFDVLARVSARLGHDLTLRIFDHLKDKSLSYFLCRPQAELLQVLRNDVLTLEQGFAQLVGQALIATFQTLVILIIMLMWEPGIALLCFTGLGASAALIWLASKLTSTALTKEIQANASIADHLLLVLGLRGFFLRVSSSPGWARTRLEELLQRYREAMIRRRVRPNWVLVAGEGVGTVTYFCFYLIGAYFVTGGSSTIGSLVAMTAMVAYLIGSMNQIAPTYVGLADAWVRLKRIECELSNGPASAQWGSYAPSMLSGSFELDGVTVRYGDTLALSCVSLSFSPGRITAIVGRSGAGKTTATLLLLGLIEPECGRVLADGVPLREWQREALWHHVGYVPQEAVLFHGSARDNITAGRSLSEAELVAASKAAGIHDRFVASPEGYDFDAGENGFRLSAGERQRIGLARALAGRPAVFILDEPTANLDAATEALIKQTLIEQRNAGRTVIVVTHDLGTLAIADDVAVLDRGVLAGFGPLESAPIQALLTAPAQSLRVAEDDMADNPMR